MAAEMTLQFDRDANILSISTRPPYPEQESEEIGDANVARLNPLMHEVEYLAVLFFSTRQVVTIP